MATDSERYEPSSSSRTGTPPDEFFKKNEILSRELQHCKAVARYAGLTGSPDENGGEVLKSVLPDRVSRGTGTYLTEARRSTWWALEIGGGGNPHSHDLCAAAKNASAVWERRQNRRRGARLNWLLPNKERENKNRTGA
jgi:hypothetical protein